MGKLPALCLALFIVMTVSAQRFHVGVFGGLAAYNGDLTEKIFPKRVTNGAIGITGNYELTDNIMLRGGFTYAVVGGADRFSENTARRMRNLSFETTVSEFSLLGEYYLNSLYDHRFSPYVYAGLALYHFNPYTFNGTTERIYLKPLGTEGQGLAGYPEKRPYGLTQVAVPFGGGVKFAVNDKLHVGLEGGLRVLFTDYLDDVSTTYADPTDLLAGRGQVAVDISYREDELPDGNAGYPAKGYQRGGAEMKDFYYFTGLHVTYRLGNGNSGGLFGGGGRKSKLGCPANIY